MTSLSTRTTTTPVGGTASASRTRPSGRPAGSRFAVDLGDVKLPEVVERRVEAEIQAVVLRGLLDADASGARAFERRIIQQFPGGLAGFFLGDDPVFPWPELPDGGPVLTPSDHTVVMRSLMDNAFAVLKHLPEDPRTRKPEGEEVLRAMVEVGTVPDVVKDIVAMILELLESLGSARGDEPAGLRRSVDDLRVRLSRLPLEEKVRALRGDLQGDYREHDGLSRGMLVAADILEDGAATIYSADHPFNRMLAEGRGTRAPSMGATADADGVGAAFGAAIGFGVGGIGAGPGGIAGGAAASAGQVVSDLIDWIFD